MEFQITDDILRHEGKIYCRIFQISGNESDCVNVSVSYKDDLLISALIRPNHPAYLDEILFDGGQCLVVMIHTLLIHIHKLIPTITEVEFDDNTNIVEDKNIQIPLYYFSIAFNGETWYEKHFNANKKIQKNMPNIKQE